MRRLIGLLIIACEIAFWIFVLAGLLARYAFNRKKLGAILLFCTPIVDLFLLVATVIDLQHGGVANMFHGLAAVYIGVSVGFGKRMIKWADEQFVYRFKKGEKPVKKKLYGKEHAQIERAGWYRHLLSWFVGSTLLAMIIFWIHDFSQTAKLFQTFLMWTIVLVIDFLISFSYTVFPKKG